MRAGVHSGIDDASDLEFYDTKMLWQWMRFIGDVPFAFAALIEDCGSAGGTGLEGRNP